MHPRLLETLRDAQRFGFFGPGPIDAAVDHARAFVSVLEPWSPGTRLIDLGSGGGLPGLVIADAVPAALVSDVRIVLLDRRRKRTDFLDRAVRRLGFDHVEVWAMDVVEAIRLVGNGDVPAFDTVTARGFGPPEDTLAAAAALRAPTGRIVISEPPSGDRWSSAQLADLGLRGERVGAVRLFTSA